MMNTSPAKQRSADGKNLVRWKTLFLLLFTFSTGFGLGYNVGRLPQAVPPPIDGSADAPTVRRGDAQTGFDSSNSDEYALRDVLNKTAFEVTKEEEKASSSEAQQPKTGTEAFQWLKNFQPAAAGIARINEIKFSEAFDYGYPKRVYTPDEPDAEVMILYRDQSAKPLSLVTSPPSNNTEDDPPPLFDNPMEATQNCDVMSVVNTGRGEQAGSMRQCVVIRDHYLSHHVERWQRVGNGSVPLKVIPRAERIYNKLKQVSVRPPRPDEAKFHFKKLQQFLQNHETNLKALEPILSSIAVDNRVVVMTCSKDHRETLANFYCSARAKNFNLGNVIVFATDPETESFAKSLGLTSYYDAADFQWIPSGNAVYGDYAFADAMWAKVVSAYLVSSLGYDFLFQDVDIVWLRNPMDRLLETKGAFDFAFQDDGARTTRFAPYSPNSGFYFAWNNDQTRDVFASRILLGHQIRIDRSDQSVFSQILVEHASRFGLRVKTLPEEEFPAGQFQQTYKSTTFLTNVLAGKVFPYIMHINWATGRKEKLDRYYQFGMWYVSDNCPLDEGASGCCLAKPKIECNIEKLPCAMNHA